MGTEVVKPLVYSLAVLVIASVWVLKYRSARGGRRYAKGRRPIYRDDRFRLHGKIIFVAMNVLTLTSFWTDAGILLLIGEGDALRAAGMVALIAGTVLYFKALGHLGKNYSPCFDAHLPFQIVTHGPYRCIRHPLYLANILQGVGFILTSGSLWVLLLAAYGSLRIFRSIAREESYLAKTFPEYENYRARTSRLIPFIY